MRVDTWAKGLLAIAMCFCLLCVFSVPSRAADFKVGKINLADVYRGSEKLKAAAAELKQMQLEAEAKMGPLKDAVAKIHEQLKSGESTMKQEEKDKLQADLKEKVQEIENQQQTLRAKITFKQKSIQNALVGQIREVIKKVGEKEGLAGIFSSETLLYSEGIPDLTAQVLQELETMPALESSKP
jgi:Skp family chaperone for outer membrane proteins